VGQKVSLLDPSFWALRAHPHRGLQRSRSQGCRRRSLVCFLNTEMSTTEAELAAAKDEIVKLRAEVEALKSGKPPADMWMRTAGKRVRNSPVSTARCHQRAHSNPLAIVVTLGH